MASFDQFLFSFDFLGEAQHALFVTFPEVLAGALAGAILWGKFLLLMLVVIGIVYLAVELVFG